MPYERLLAGNSSISLAGSEEQIIFFQQSPKMLKMASETFIHALLLFFRSFSQNFPLGAPVIITSKHGTTIFFSLQSYSKKTSRKNVPKGARTNKQNVLMPPGHPTILLKSN